MEEKRRTRSRLSLLAVQSIVCGVILLLVLVIRLIGGNAWESLRSMLQDWMTDEGITAVVTEDAVGGRDIPPADTVSALPEGVSGSVITVPHTTAPLEKGTVTSVFGWRTDPIRGGTGFHTGVDVAAQAGSALYAPFDGVVTEAAWDNSYGYYVVIESGLFRVLYAHGESLLCRTGDTVRAGTTVARVGHTGDATGNHVHIELICDGVRFDPASLIPEAWYA